MHIPTHMHRTFMHSFSHLCTPHKLPCILSRAHYLLSCKDGRELDPAPSSGTGHFALVSLSLASYAVQSCSVLTGEPFAPCSAYLSPVPYFEQCRRDACRCGQPCLCATLAHYARLCRRHGLPVDFRAHLPACGECPLHMHSGRTARGTAFQTQCPPVPQLYTEPTAQILQPCSVPLPPQLLIVPL